jgi:PAS domain S-box-containing protein
MPEDALRNEHLAGILDAAPIAMLVVDAGGTIRFANRQASVTFGRDPRELTGADVGLLMPERFRGGHRTLLERFFASPVHRVMGVGREIVGLRGDGREMPLEVGLTPLSSDGDPLAIAAVIDITERKRREADFTLARIVQNAMLPTEVPEGTGLDIAALSEPADAAGGDFYDYVPLDGDRLAVVVGDASGHGFAAALVTVAARSYLRACSRSERDAARVLAQVNRLLLDDDLDGRFVTLFYAGIDPRSRTVEFAGAGHAGFLFDAHGDLRRELPSTGPPLGWFPDSEYPVLKLEVEPGDLLLLLTDGIEEAMDAAGACFGRARLLASVRAHATRPVREIVAGLHRSVHAHQGTAGQHDDATVVAVRFPG